jgi:hypothetical protein
MALTFLKFSYLFGRFFRYFFSSELSKRGQKTTKILKTEKKKDFGKMGELCECVCVR